MIRPYQYSFVFDPDMDWADWNGAILMWYGEQPLPYIEDELDWKELASSMAGSAFFAPYGIPTPDDYDDWRQWAAEVTALINGKIKLEPV